MGEVFAGFVCGFALSLIFAPLVAILLLRLRASSPLMARLLPVEVSPIALTLTIHFGLLFFWTGLGIVLGLLLLAMDGGSQVLGSANAPFTLLVASLVLMMSAPPALLIAPLRRYVISSAIVVLGVFGWLMPHLANLTSFD